MWVKEKLWGAINNSECKQSNFMAWKANFIYSRVLRWTTLWQSNAPHERSYLINRDEFPLLLFYNLCITLTTDLVVAEKSVKLCVKLWDCKEQSAYDCNKNKKLGGFRKEYYIFIQKRRDKE